LLCQFLFVDIFLLWTLPLKIAIFNSFLIHFYYRVCFRCCFCSNLFRTVLHLHQLSLCLCFWKFPFGTSP
jgi:hypothetical protein